MSLWRYDHEESCIVFPVGNHAFERLSCQRGPQNGANHYVVAITCDDGYDGQVLVPAAPPAFSVPGFFDEEMDGLGIRRAITVKVGGEVVYAWEHPGIGFYDQLVDCSYEIGGAIVEVKVQRIYTGGE